MSNLERRRPSPEQLLKVAEAEQRLLLRGKLKVFLGYASGVGKSFRMFSEGRRRKERGQDVVVAAVQPHPQQEVEELVSTFEQIPLLMVHDRPCLDVETILKRHPGLCLIDGLAYTNPPGRRNRYRWQDVEQILNAGINVITSVNL